MVQRRTPLVWSTAFGLVAIGCAACSVLFVSSDKQCATDADCHARGSEFASARCSARGMCLVVDEFDAGPETEGGTDASADPFACGKVAAPRPDPATQVDLSLRFIDNSAGGPPKDAVTRLCSSSDPQCTSPRVLVGEPSDAGAGFVVPNAAGIVSAKVELGFEGYFELQAPGFPPNFRSTSPALWRPENHDDHTLARTEEVD